MKKRLFAVLLSAAFLISLFPVTAFAGSGAKASITVSDNTDDYATVQLAVNAAESGETVTMCSDSTEDIVIANGKNVILNLNGKTLTGNITNNGTLTVSESKNGETNKIAGTVTNNGILSLGNDTCVKSFINKDGGTANLGNVTTENGWTLEAGSVTNVTGYLKNEYEVGKMSSNIGMINGTVYAASGILDLRGVDLRVKSSGSSDPVIKGGTAENPVTLTELKATRVFFGDSYDGAGSQTIGKITLENCTTAYRYALAVYYDDLTVGEVTVDAGSDDWYWDQQYNPYNYQMYTGYGGTITVNKSLTTGEFMDASSSLGYTGSINLADGAVLNCLDFRNTGNVKEETLSQKNVHVNGSGATLNAAALNNHAITSFGTVNMTAHPTMSTALGCMISVNYGTDAVLNIGTLNFLNMDGDSTGNLMRAGDNAITTIGSLTSSAAGADFYVTGTSKTTVNEDGGNKVSYIGNIIFNKYSDSESNASFSLKLDSEDDSFTGAVKGVSSEKNRWGNWGWPVNDDAFSNPENVKHMTLDLTNGSRWTLTDDSIVNSLTVKASSISGDKTVTLQSGTSSMEDAALAGSLVNAADSVLYLKGSTTVSGSVVNNGTILVDMTGATEDSIKLVDAVETSDYGTYQFAAGKDYGYLLEVKDNDLYAVYNHIHSWTYTLSGKDTVNAVCSGTGEACRYTDVSLTIIAPAGLTYDGTDKTASFGTAAGFLHGALPEITYEYKATEDGTYAAAENLSKAGYYKASFTVGEGAAAKTGTVEYEVKKAKVTVTAENKSMNLGDQVPEFTANVTGLIGKDQIEYGFRAIQTPKCQGKYSIDPVGDAIQGNYEVTYIKGALTVKTVKSELEADSEGVAKVLEKYTEKEEYREKGLGVELRTDGEVSQTDKDKITEKAGTDKRILLFDAELYLIITDNNQVTEKDIGDENDTLIGVSYKFDFTNKKDIQTFRVHKDVCEELTVIPNADGEYVQYNEKAGKITVYAKKYSAFAISYNEVPIPDTGDTTYTAFYVLSGMIVVMLMAAAFFLKKKEN